MKVPISEIFYSLQGEGDSSGVPAVFIRLGGCNLMCGGQGTQFDKQLHNGATWRCDTIEVWMKAKAIELEKAFTKEITNAILNDAIVVITGGEPLMQQKNVQLIIDYVKAINENTIIEIETNGTIMPNESILNTCKFNCSPKLSNSGMEEDLRLKEDVLRKLNDFNTIFKIVISSKDDFSEVVNKFLPIIGTQKLYLMPAGSSKNELKHTRQLTAELCKTNYIKFTDRLHINIWNKKTGV